MTQQQFDSDELMATVREGLREPHGQDGVIAALDILGRMREQRAVPLFKEALDHPNNGTRTTAALSLCWCGDLQGLAALKQWASDVYGNPKRATQAIHKLAELAEIGDYHGIATLRNLQREHGAASLGFRGKDRTVSSIVDSLIGPVSGGSATPSDHNAVKEPKKAGGCFIATAACGNPVAAEVTVLSAFRDEVLMRTRIGRRFVSLYYAVSPPIAAVVARSKRIRSIAMIVLVTPAAYIATVLLNRQFPSRGR